MNMFTSRSSMLTPIIQIFITATSIDGGAPMRTASRFASLGAVLVFLLVSTPQTSLSQVPARSMIGLGLSDAPGAAGAVVGVVASGGPADHAGVRVRDIVTAINGSAVANASTMSSSIRTMSPGQTARLSILRASDSGVQQLTIAVVVGTAQGTDNALHPASASAAASATVHPLSVADYASFTDPLEQAFTVQVPSGWRTVGGLARRSALQINPFLRSLSPDKMTYLLIGEPTLPSYVPPSPMRNAIGYREGKLFDAGLGGLAMVLHYMPGAEFARLYGQSALPGLCPGLQFSGARARLDMAQNADKLVPTVIPSVSTGGEARFSCRHNGQQMEARIEAVTRTTRDSVMWNVIFLKGFLAPASQADTAEEILTRVGASFTFNQAWMQKQNNLDQQAVASINRRMQEFFRQEQGVIQNLNSVDQSFSSMDEIVSGYSTYHDAATGNDYKLSNTNPDKWIDNSTGRIFSTPTNSPPPWGPALSPLTHVSQ
jgi:hypothetical protein